MARAALAAADVARESAGEEEGVRMGEALREAEEGWRVARVERDAGKVCPRKMVNRLLPGHQKYYTDGSY